MNYQIRTPYCILPEGTYSIPDLNNASDDDRLFIVTNDISVREALIEALNTQLEKRRKISAEMFNDLLDDALTSLGQRNNQIDLAFLLMHPGGCLVAQMGRSRVMHISALNHEIAYDSRNQIQDYNTKARAEVLKDISDGDVIIITLADRVDGHKLCQVIADYAMSDELNVMLHKALGVNREEAPASYIIQLQEVKGGALSKLSDVNWKWITLYLLLAALIAGLAWLSLTGGLKMPKFFDDDPATEVTVDTLSTDTTARDSLIPALDVTVEEEPVAEKPKKDTARVVKPKAEEPVVKEEAPAAPSLHDAPAVAKPELNVDEPSSPATPPPVPSEPEP